MSWGRSNSSYIAFVVECSDSLHFVWFVWSGIDGRYPELTLAFFSSVNEFLIFLLLLFTLLFIDLSVGGYGREKVGARIWAGVCVVCLLKVSRDHFGGLALVHHV